MDGEVFDGCFWMVHCHGDWEKGQGGKGAVDEGDSFVRLILKVEAVMQASAFSFKFLSHLPESKIAYTLFNFLSKHSKSHRIAHDATHIFFIISGIYITSSLSTRFRACKFLSTFASLIG